MRKSDRIAQICHQTREVKSTKWLLASIYNDTRVIVVCRNMQHLEILTSMYGSYMSKLSRWKKLLRKLFPKGTPTFVTLSYDFSTADRPIIFDNGTLG